MTEREKKELREEYRRSAEKEIYGLRRKVQDEQEAAGGLEKFVFFAEEWIDPALEIGLLVVGGLSVISFMIASATISLGEWMMTSILARPLVIMLLLEAVLRLLLPRLAAASEKSRNQELERSCEEEEKRIKARYDRMAEEEIRRREAERKAYMARFDAKAEKLRKNPAALRELYLYAFRMLDNAIAAAERKAASKDRQIQGTLKYTVKQDRVEYSYYEDGRYPTRSDYRFEDARYQDLKLPEDREAVANFIAWMFYGHCKTKYASKKYSIKMEHEDSSVTFTVVWPNPGYKSARAIL